MVERAEKVAGQIARKTMEWYPGQYTHIHGYEGTFKGKFAEVGFERLLGGVVSKAIAARILETPKNPVRLRNNEMQPPVKSDELKTTGIFHPQNLAFETRLWFRALARKRLMKLHGDEQMSVEDGRRWMQFGEAISRIEDGIVTDAIEKAQGKGKPFINKMTGMQGWHLPHETAEQAILDAAVAASRAAKGFGTGQTGQFREIVEAMRNARAKPKNSSAGQRLKRWGARLPERINRAAKDHWARKY
ncbi:MAG: hypothetical protein V1708_00900 [Candidatus Micrarchaeota archaeon]